MRAAPSGAPRRSNLRNIRLLAGDNFIDQIAVFLGKRIHLGEGAVQLVLGNLGLLLQRLELVIGVSAHISKRYLVVLRLTPGHADQVLAALTGERRNRHANDIAVVGGVKAEIRGGDRKSVV